MPELPEVEILVRHLCPQVQGRVVRNLEVLHPRSVWDCSVRRLVAGVRGWRIVSLTRRAKYVRFGLSNGGSFLIHLGMTGRVFVAGARRHAKHDVARFRLNSGVMVFHDVRKFGHLALGDASLAKLGPEPFSREFTGEYLASRLRDSRAPIKVRLLDQSLVAGLGNIYACEALWRARIDPRLRCGKLGNVRLGRLRASIVSGLRRAIRLGGGVSLAFNSPNPPDGVFYYGSGNRRGRPAEHFNVYDREGKPCRRCRVAIKRIVQAGRSTFFCPRCQGGR